MRRYLLPVGASLLFIAWSPFIRGIRDAIDAVLGASFAAGVGLMLGAIVLGALGWGARRVRTDRVRRLGSMALAPVLFAAYAIAVRTGVPEVDAVERVHFVEYGLLAMLFYRAMRDLRLGVAVVMTLLAGTLTGIAEEWVQWLVPTRVGEAHDVLLNLVALACGLLFATGLFPSAAGGWRLTARQVRRVLGLATVVVLSFAGFFHCAHLGYELSDPAIGRFRSFYTKRQLAAIAADRAVRWRTDPPTSLEPMAIQDDYLVEGASHVSQRNDSYEHGRFRDAWLENAILERYYDPLLDQWSMSNGEIHRWPAAQRAEVEAKGAGPVDGTYRSPVNMDRVVTAPSKPRFWLLVTLVVSAILAWALALSRREARRDTSGAGSRG